MNDEPSRPSAESQSLSPEESAIKQSASRGASTPHTSRSEPARSHGQQTNSRRYTPILRPAVGVLLFGALLPAFTLWYELQTRLCATEWFDPLPSWLNVVLVALVAASNFLIFTTRWWRPGRALSAVAQLNAVSLGVVIAYSVVFLPTLPISFVGLIFMGMGAMPLSPLLALFATMSARRCLPHWGRVLGEEPRRLPRWWPATLATLVVLAFGPARSSLTSYWMQQAMEEDAAVRNSALRWLRAIGSRQTMLEFCYERGSWADFTFFPKPRIDTEAARQAYFRVTGEPFARQKISLAQGREGLRGWRTDADVGAEQVAGRAPGLSLEGSQIDGKINATALTDYTEWTLDFRNVSDLPAEARALVQLPAGGVVSRVTLWINGQPQEAAFGGRAQTRAAYREVAVVQRRDPILVTTSGLDRALVQCFPVPPDGGSMKVRIGITSPLQVIDDAHATTALPRIVDRNFDSGANLIHEVWVESSLPFASGGQKQVKRLNDRALSLEPPVMVNCDPRHQVFSTDPSDPGGRICQTVEKVAASRPKRIALVFDGSEAMRSHARPLARALHGFSTSEVAAFYAGDDTLAWDGHEPLDAWLARQRPRGGCDNISALVAAWDYATDSADSAIVWVHGPQPVLLSRLEPLQQRMQRDQSPPTLYLLDIEDGPNRILSEFDSFPRVKSLPAGITPSARLTTLLDQWSGQRMAFSVKRERVPNLPGAPELIGDERHLARLWGMSEVERLRQQPATLDAAVKLAIELQLVTPVSGAVVLERKEQYDKHGLTPGNPDTVPTVPEPSTGLFAFAGLVWCGLRRHRR